MEYLLSFILVVGIIILVHELGHFLAARAVGIRVDRFSIGFGPKIVAVQRGETEYRIAWVPLGGYVKMAGMIDESFDTEESEFDPEDPRLFINKKGWQKILVISAGVIMNMILAAVVLWGVYATRGIPTVPEQLETVIEAPVPGYPAAEAGLERGDRIVSVDGEPVKLWEDLVDVIYARPDKEVTVEYEREGRIESVVLTTREERQPGSEVPVGKIGIGPLLEYEPVGAGKAFVYGWVATWSILKQTAQAIGMLVAGQASVKDLAGPVGIAKMTGDTAREGFGNLFELLALISVNIGFLNILPVPALDGGHLVLILIEAVRRRPLSTRIKIWVQQIGMILLLALIAVVIFNDVMRLR
ncbi:MAG: RIP metalloprotease RseP [Candidatus Eisenbacteria bacterium]|nr:RIP metalloprotease RseP [Candidatus Latescibacterota bacterium]MBD3303149.1 RIP metalloprotease RseP [Candidatus Eisenbacteria bacterium]